jgi:hypothetical protein
MADHTLTLNYDGTAFKPDVDPLPVKLGDTVTFKLGTAPAGSRFTITMKEPQFFSADVADDSAPKITVKMALLSLTTYHCRLLNSDGTVVASSSEGGGMKPG